MAYRRIKEHILSDLKTPSWPQAQARMAQRPPQQSINALFSLLFNDQPLIRWRAVSAMGTVTARLADQRMESARVVMRRLIWNLNDESGGIGWGSPEAMGDICACHQPLAGEFAHILISYANPDGNFLEHPTLQRGLLWGLGRAALRRPQLMAPCAEFLLPFFLSNDPVHRGLAARAAGAFGQPKLKAALADLKNDPAAIDLYTNGRIRATTVQDLARQALGRIDG